MGYPRRFYVLYPAGGLLGLAAVTQYWDSTESSSAIVWLGALVASSTGLWLGTLNAVVGRGGSERGDKAPLGVGLVGVLLGVPVLLFVRRFVEPELALWLLGLMFVCLSAGFLSAAWYLRSHPRMSGSVVPDSESVPDTPPEE